MLLIVIIIPVFSCPLAFQARCFGGEKKTFLWKVGRLKGKEIRRHVRRGAGWKDEDGEKSLFMVKRRQKQRK